MPKRIALFILGLFLAIGAFLLYQYVGGQDSVTKPKAKLNAATLPTTLPLSIVSRLPNMQLEYVITAAESPQPMLDANKNPIPGQFILKQPRATFYERGGRIIQVSADTCQAVIEQGAKGPSLGSLSGSAKGSKLGDAMTLRTGLLHGNVRMTISARPGATANDPLSGGLRAYFDDDLVLDGVQEILTTTGGIQLRSNVIGFDGQGMQLAFNREAKRIEYLHIDKGNQVIIRGQGTKLLSLAAPPSTAPSTKPATKPQLASTKPSKDAIPPTNYRMSFGQDITATILTKLPDDKLGQSTLTSDRLFLTFMAASEESPATQPATSSQPATAEAEPPAAAVLQIVEKPEPIAPAGPNDVVVSWVGSMEMRPSEELLADVHDIRFEALGTAVKPVEIKDPRFSTRAGRIVYNGSDQKIFLQPDAFKTVLLTYIAQGTSPLQGNIECTGLAFDQLSHHAILTGPGTLLSKAADGDTTNLTWKTRMDLDLESIPDAKDSKNTNLAIRHAVMDGVTIKTNTFDLKSDLFDALIANIHDGKKQTQSLEHLLATGNVVVNSYKKTAPGAAPSGERSGMQTQRMEILTTTSPDSKIPLPSQLLADGDVTAFRITDKAKSLTASLAPAATLPAAPAQPGPSLQKETITAPKLVALLVAKPKPPATASAPATTTAPAPADAFASLGQNFDVSRFQATGGTRVEITSPKSTPILALAESIDAHPARIDEQGNSDKGTAILLAAATPNAPPVTVSLGNNALQGQRIDLNQNTESFTVPGAGTFNFILPADKKANRPASPMVVTWQDQMQYDNQKHLAIFTGKPVARVPGENSDQAGLSSEKTLVVQLKERPKPTATASAPASAPAATSDSPFADANLDLDWIQADGNVQALGAQFTPDNKLLTRIRLSAPNPSTTKLGQLRYSASDQAFTMDGPGDLVFENLKPDKAGDRMSSTGLSAFHWTGNLKYDDKASTVTIAKDVDFYFQPTKPFKFSSSLTGATPAPATAPTTATAPQKPDLLHLHTGQIVATLTKSKDAAGKTVESPIALGSGGKQDVSKVQATGTASIDVGNYHIEGSSMNVDVPNNLITITGTADDPVTAVIIGSGKRITATAIDLDMTKDKNYFHFTNPKGDLSGFGQ